jgi:hypothetical protein
MDYILHILGLCGEQHTNLIALIAEWPIIHNILNYLKNTIK